MTTAPGTRRHPARFDPIRWRYPWPEDDPWPEWETPWAAAGDAATGPVVVIAARDREVRPVRLFVHRPPWAPADVVEVICEEDARRFDGSMSSPELRLTACPDAAAIDVAVDAHLRGLTAAFGLVPFDARADVPAWLRDVRLVVNLHGQHWTGHVFNTFADMTRALELVCRAIDGRHVLAYLPGFEGRYYHDYPFYRPGRDLGGERDFAAFVDAAHRLGVHVMPMFGLHGVNAARYPDWETAAFRTTRGRSLALVNRPDWDGDRAGEDDQVFCNPGEPGFRAHLLEQVAAIVADFGVDGVFLDTSGCWFNDPRWSAVEGCRLLVAELRGRAPDLLVAGEGWFDALLAIFPLNQSWLGLDRALARPELLTRFAREVGHLSLGAPGWGSTGVHEGGWYPPPPERVAEGRIPTVVVVGGTMAHDAEELLRRCGLASRPDG
jgi:hypothetical protein